MIFDNCRSSSSMYVWQISSLISQELWGKNGLYATKELNHNDTSSNCKCMFSSVIDFVQYNFDFVAADLFFTFIQQK